MILETVGPNGEPVPSGQPGKILVSLLSNYGFPLIRYEIGDVGVRSGKSCDCGLPLTVLDRVEGRNTEFLLTVSGGYIFPIYVRHLIGVVHNSGVIRRFEIVQDARDHAVLALEIEPSATESIVGASIGNIRRDLMTVFGSGMNLEINRVDRIPESGSGKFIACVNKTVRHPMKILMTVRCPKPGSSSSRERPVVRQRMK